MTEAGEAPILDVTRLKRRSFEEDQARVNMLIRNAKRRCFAESMIRAAVPVKSMVEVNGAVRRIEDITD